MPRFRRGWRRVMGPGRPMKPRSIGMTPVVTSFFPDRDIRNPDGAGDPIVLDFDEFEALRLVDYEGLTQQEAAERMKISRGTIWRCVDSARKKITSMLVEGRALIIRR